MLRNAIKGVLHINLNYNLVGMKIESYSNAMDNSLAIALHYYSKLVGS